MFCIILKILVLIEKKTCTGSATNKQIECGLAWSVLLSTTSTHRYSG